MNEKYVGTLEKLEATGVCISCGKPKHKGDCIFNKFKDGPYAGFVDSPFRGEMRTGKCESCGKQAELVCNFIWECDTCRYIHR